MLASQVLKLGALLKLMKMVKSNFIEEAIKGLYAVSALVQNSLAGQELFFAEDGLLLLQVIYLRITVLLSYLEFALL